MLGIACATLTAAGALALLLLLRVMHGHEKRSEGCCHSVLVTCGERRRAMCTGVGNAHASLALVRDSCSRQVMELAHAVQHHAHVRINLRHNKASSSTTTASAVGTLWMRALVVLVWCLRLPFDWEQAQVLHAVVTCHAKGLEHSRFQISNSSPWLPVSSKRLADLGIDAVVLAHTHGLFALSKLLGPLLPAMLPLPVVSTHHTLLCVL